MNQYGFETPHTTGATSLATRGLDGRRFPILESQGSVLCADWFTFQINLTEVLKDPAALLKE